MNESIIHTSKIKNERDALRRDLSSGDISGRVILSGLITDTFFMYALWFNVVCEFPVKKQIHIQEHVSPRVVLGVCFFSRVSNIFAIIDLLAGVGRFRLVSPPAVGWFHLGAKRPDVGPTPAEGRWSVGRRPHRP